MAETLEPEIEFQVDRARSGAPSLRIGGRRAHSAYDPEGEAPLQAARILEGVGSASAISLIGAGLGHLTRELRRRSPVPVVVWEPFPGMRAALREEIGADGETATSPEDHARALARALPPRGYALPAVHPGYEELTRFEQRHALRVQRHRIRAQGVAARSRAIVSERSLASLERMPGLRAMTELAGALAGRSVVIASGGPSLDLALPALGEAHDAAVVAAPQALRRLLDAGIRVDYVISVDPADLLTPILGEGGAPFGALLADTCAPPASLDRCRDRCFLFHLQSPQVVQQAWEAAGLPVIDEPLITVSEIGVHLARELGARRILLAGVDFVSESRGYGEPFRVRGMNGSLVPTNPHYFHGARYLGTALAGLDVVRLGAGVDVPGAAPIAASDVGAWLAEARAGKPVHVGSSSTRALERAVTKLLEGAPPPPAANAVPTDGTWDDFLPLPAGEVAVRWKRLRQELPGAGPGGA